MRVTLFRPRLSDRSPLSEEGFTWTFARSAFNAISRTKVGRGSDIAPFSLMVLAALTPPEWEVAIVDEEVEEISFDDPPDVAGITMLTTTAPRAYEIADAFRQLGTKVVLGGIHASVLPEEAIEHADAVVIGEAEDVWPEVLENVRDGNLKAFYRRSVPWDMCDMPPPRQDLISRDRYLTANLVQTTRGCPHRCSFCSIQAIAGNFHRSRPIPDVIAELERLPDPLTVFVDDNIIGDPEYAKALFKAMIPLKLRWWGQATIRIVDDDDLLGLAARSGCRILLVGLESLSDENLRAVGKAKTNRVSDYEQAIRKLHEHGICVAGSFILGLDGDGHDVFARTADFIQSNQIDLPMVGVLTPYPGTRLFAKLDREKRLLHKKWRHYGEAVGEVVFHPRHMTPEELRDGYRSLGRDIYSVRAMIERLAGVRQNLVPAVAYNLAHRRYFV